MKKSLLFISCDEAKHICDKAQYNEASAWEKIKFNMRLSWCRFTKAYYKSNTKLTDAMNASKLDALNPKEREAMELKFKEELSKQEK